MPFTKNAKATPTYFHAISEALNELHIFKGKMKYDQVTISDAYRASRRNTSVLCGIGIAWSAAQFEIERIHLPSVGDVSIGTASIPIIIGAMCIYTMVRSTLEYMMQPAETRRATLAQVDYTITIYLVKFTIIALSLSAVARSWLTILYIGAAFLIAITSFLVISYALLFLLMPFRMWVRGLSGRHSIASAAIEATYYSFALAWLALGILIVLMGFNVVNPFIYLGSEYSDITSPQLFTFSIVSLALLVSVYFDDKFLGMVFAFVPTIIERTYYEDGRKIYSQEANPEHPDYENLKNTIQPFVYTKVTADEVKKSQQSEKKAPNSD